MIKPLTDNDLEIIKWKTWEPLRRNQDYKNEYAKLRAVSFFDLDAKATFCEKWKMQSPLDPECDFDALYGPFKGESEKDAKKRIQGYFPEYTPESDNAAFVDFDIKHPGNFLIDGKYLKVSINLEKSRNQIEGEIEKILDKYLAKKTKDFYEIGEEATSKTYKEVWKSCFQVYDMVQYEGLSFPDIAIKLKIKINTIHKQFERAWKNINPEKEYPTKRYRETEIPFPCDGCIKRETIVCKTCKKMEKFQSQYDARSGGIAPGNFDKLADNEALKDWERDN